ncbi:hypothetical protein Scep_030311 [Stephania cephalantha]|uniref:VOC domain-containing protein n=1 Tax=Stephania cephalantha TaxID=152367 RepID=A0AAP0E279_9MAGN
MAAAKGVSLSHIARVSNDVKRLANFYEEVLGFERIETPAFDGGEVIWMRLPNSKTTIHISQRMEAGPRLEERSGADPKRLPRGHHVCFSVTNFDEFVRSLKEKGIETFEKAQPDGKTKQVFFFDPDGKLFIF